MRDAYVRLVRSVTPAFRRSGLLDRWERMPRTRVSTWARSLFAIHDVDQMIELDLPWWNLRAADEVAERLSSRPDTRVFEFGSGASTVWLSKRAHHVTSIEHDAEWATAVRPRLGTNVTLRLVAADTEFDAQYASEQRAAIGQSFKAYASAIDAETEPFDLIVIDGRARAACLSHAIAHLAPGGTIVFDDSGRRRYRTAIDASGLAESRYRGLSACVPYPDSTSLLSAPAAG